MIAEIKVGDQFLNDFKHVLLIAGQAFAAKRNEGQTAPAVIISGTGVRRQADTTGIGIDPPGHFGIIMN